MLFCKLQIPEFMLQGKYHEAVSTSYCGKKNTRKREQVLTGRSYVKIEMLQEALVLVSAKSLLSVRIQADDI
jgi:hypothetical protein